MPETPAGLRLVSIQVGTPQSYLAPHDGGTYRSAIDKRPVTGRVQLTATLEAGTPIELQARPHPAWTVRRAARVMANHQSLRQDAAALAQLPALAADWRYRLAKFA